MKDNDIVMKLFSESDISPWLLHDSLPSLKRLLAICPGRIYISSARRRKVLVDCLNRFFSLEAFLISKAVQLQGQGQAAGARPDGRHYLDSMSCHCQLSSVCNLRTFCQRLLHLRQQAHLRLLYASFSWHDVYEPVCPKLFSRTYYGVRVQLDEWYPT